MLTSIESPAQDLAMEAQELYNGILTIDYPLALVDFLGVEVYDYKIADFRTTTELDSHRFDVKDLETVVKCGLKAVKLNKAALTEIYEDQIGYDPFEDDPSATVQEVQNTLHEYMIERYN